MNKKLLTLVAVLSFFNVYSQLVVTPSANGNNLAQVIAGTGVQISNVTFSCGTNGAGTFTQTGTNLGLGTGVVITSGNATNSAGPVGNFASTDNLSGTDADLDNIASAAVQDVCRLEFDFVPIGPAIQFNYVWGSEEYPEWVNAGYNDAFGFFISGPIPGGGTYNSQNIAFIPGTSTPVTIDNVNANSNNTYFIDNQSQGNAFITYDGMTTVLTATLYVVPCSTYHIKLAVGDVGDGIYDSGIFLESNSLTSSGSTVSSAVVTPGFLSTFEGCVNGQFNFTLPIAPFTSTALNYTVTGTATNGTDFNLLPGIVYFSPGQTQTSINLVPIQDGLPEGSETVTVNIINPCDGSVLSSSTLTIGDSPSINISASDQSLCAGQSTTLTASGGNSFSWSASPPGGGLNATNIQNPTATPLTSTTYTVTATFASCVSTASIDIGVSNLTAVATVLPSQVCENDTVLLVVNPSGGQGPNTISWSPFSQVFEPNNDSTFAVVPTSTTFSVTVVDSFGCNVSGNAPVTIFNQPSLSINGITPVCPGNSTTISTSTSFASYNWSNGQTSSTISVTNPGQYWATVTSSNGCEYVTDTFTLTNFNVVNPSLGSDTTVCIGQIVNYAIPVGFTNPIWSTGSNNPSISVNSNSTIFYSANDQNGCAVVSDTVEVNIVQVVYVDLEPDTSICLGQSWTYNASPTVSNIVWSNGASGVGSITVNTSQTVFYSGISTIGSCPVISDTVQFTVNPLLQIPLGPDTTVCIGQSVVYTSLPGSTNILWMNNSSNSSITVSVPTSVYYSGETSEGCLFISDTATMNNATVIALPFGPDTSVCPGSSITYTALPNVTNVVWSTGATGVNSVTVSAPANVWYSGFIDGVCPAQSDTAILSVRVLPTATITATPSVICQGESSWLTVNTQPGYIYTWNPGSVVNDSLQVSVAGTYTVTINDGFCENSSSTNIIVNTHPPVSIGNNQTVCPGISITLTPSGSPYVSYSWTGGATTSTLSTSTPGAYSVTVSDGNCTYVSNTISLFNFSIVNPIAYSDTTVCAAQPVTLTSQSGFTNVVWTGNVSNANLTTSNSGTYSFTAIDANNCTVTSNNVTITHVQYPTPVISAQPPSICDGQSSTLSVNAQSNVSYVWSPGGSSQTSFTTSTVGNYSVIATTSIANCTASANLNLLAASSPIIELGDSVNSCCDIIELNPGGGSGVSYVWSDGSTDEIRNISSSGRYSVTATNQAGCTSTDEVSVSWHCLQASATATNDTIEVGQSSQLETFTNYTSIFDYLWSPSESLNSSLIYNPLASPTSTTTYTVIIVDQVYGCSDTTSVLVNLLFPTAIVIPDAFTPNNDGLNDMFYPMISSGEKQRVLAFRVYNRWGQMIHNNPDSGWDGRYELKDQPVETYLYYVVIESPDEKISGAVKKEIFQGPFNLIR